MRDNLFRSTDGFELRDAGDGQMPTLAGRFAVFNQWTEIDSIWEGNFLERIAPGAFKKTIADNAANMRVLFQHGQDPTVGDKPLGTITDLREDSQGAAYEVRLLDTTYNADLLPGLRAGLYGASFRMRVTKEDINSSAKPSDYNPKGLPERTIREAMVPEFGPVTFPAYPGASAGIRSLTDDLMLNRMLAEHPEKVRELLDRAAPSEDAETSPEPEAETPVVDHSRREVAKARVALYERELLQAGRRA